jgi:hypothetical protein
MLPRKAIYLVTHQLAQKWFLAILVCAIGCVCLLPPGHLLADLGDSRANMYFLEHGYRWLAGLDPEFWSAPFFYPYSHNVIALSDNHLGGLPIYALFRWLGLNREISIYAWVISISVLNFFSAFWVLKRWRYSMLAAIAGAYIFCFSLPATAQLGHYQLLPRFMVPLAFYFSMQFFRSYAIQDFSLMLLSVAYQIYLGIYLGYFLGIVLVISFFGILLRKERGRRKSLDDYKTTTNTKKLRYPFSVALLLFFVILIPLAIPYLDAIHTVGPRAWNGVLLPHWQSYFIPNEESYLWGWLWFMGKSVTNAPEQCMYIGIIPLLALLAAIYPFKIYRDDSMSNPAGLMLWVLGGTILLTLSVHHFSFYKILYNYLPGAKAIRVVPRIIVVLLFPIAVVFADVVTRIFHALKVKQTQKIRISLLLLIILMIDQSASVDLVTFGQFQQRIEKIKQEFGNNRNAVLWINNVEFPGSRYLFVLAATHLDAMLAAQDLGVPTINGYSGSVPSHYPFELFALNPNVCQVWQRWRSQQGPLPKSVVFIGKNC